jgi:hypothetical protein
VRASRGTRSTSSSPATAKQGKADRTYRLIPKKFLVEMAEMVSPRSANSP